jgi:hypothetical protein
MSLNPDVQHQRLTVGLLLALRKLVDLDRGDEVFACVRTRSAIELLRTNGAGRCTV